MCERGEELIQNLKRQKKGGRKRRTEAEGCSDVRSHQECEVGKEERIAVWIAGEMKGGVRRERVEYRREGETVRRKGLKS